MRTTTEDALDGELREAVAQARAGHGKRTYTLKDWLIIGLWILAAVGAIALVLTGHVNLYQACAPGAEAIDICTSH